MRLMIILILVAALTACERYTEATSPCFGNNGKPVVTRASTGQLSFAASQPADCKFEDIGASQ